MKKENVSQREEWKGKQGRDIGRDIDSLHVQCMSAERDANRSIGRVNYKETNNHCSLLDKNLDKNLSKNVPL